MGIREAKKARTARALEDAALRLFAERGYENTTIGDLAAAADISPRTFFAYFPSKEAVLFGEFEASLISLGERLRAREPGESAIDALRAWILSYLAEEGVPDEREAQRRRIVEGHEALTGYERRISGRFERVLAEAFATDFADRPSALEPRLAAAAGAAMLLAMRPEPDLPPPSPELALRQLDQVATFLRGGVAALAEARADQAA